MRISDWSSDVCSSDLTVFSRQFAQGNLAPNIAYGAAQTRGFSDSGTQTTSFPDGEFAAVPNSSYPFTPTLGQYFTGRSEEHTSELQSLMRISYAVFCLKKKIALNRPQHNSLH